MAWLINEASGSWSSMVALDRIVRLSATKAPTANTSVVVIVFMRAPLN